MTREEEEQFLLSLEPEIRLSARFIFARRWEMRDLRIRFELEDLVQTGFLAALLALRRPHSPEHERNYCLNWAWGYMMNLIFEPHSWECRPFALIHDINIEDEVAEREQETGRNPRYERLYHAIDQLTPKQRRCLCFWHRISPDGEPIDDCEDIKPQRIRHYAYEGREIIRLVFEKGVVRGKGNRWIYPAPGDVSTFPETSPGKSILSLR